MTVNQPNGPRPTNIRPSKKLPENTYDDLPRGSRDELLELGPTKWAEKLRNQTALGVTETTFRDAHQSLLATRVRTNTLVAAAKHVGHLTPQLTSVEAWGGATFDVGMRFLHESPWMRLDEIREAMPNVNIQMLLRGRNTVGYTPYPDSVTKAFVQEAATSGIDIFRIFDALNDVSQMRPAIDAVLETNTTVAEVAMAYSGNLLDPNEDLYTLDYYLNLAEEIVEAGAHVLAIKDMAGLMRPAAAAKLVGALRERFDLPVHVHTHDTAGGQLATYLAAANAGADVVDVASAPLAGTTSQPSMSALVAAFANTERDTGIDLQSVFDMEPYWEAVRQVYAPFESGIPGPTGRVYKHEIPGGQLSNLRTQAKALGLEDRFELIEDYYAGVNEILGRPTKVTPSSKVVGDLALQLVGQGVSPEEFAGNPRKYDIPESVIGFLQGELGTPPGGWPLLREKALENRSEVDHTVQVPDELAGDLASEDHATRRAALDQLLFPKQYAEYQEHLRTYGITDQLGDKAFFYGLEEGEETMIWYGEIDENRPPLVVSLDAVSEPDEKGMRQVILTVNGQVRPITVRDESAESSVAEVEKADSSNPGHVAAPFAGAVTVTVKEGDEVKAGDPVATIEAMKMEAAISATKDGKVERVAFTQPTKVEGGDLVVVIA